MLSAVRELRAAGLSQRAIVAALAERGLVSRVGRPFAKTLAALDASINDLAIGESERLFHWPLGRRPDDHPGLSELGF